MKKLLLSALVLSTLGANAQITKNVLLYDFTGVNCQFCTGGTVIIEDLLAANPNTFVPIQVHAGSYTPPSSVLKTIFGDAIDNSLTIPGYPAGSVDMVADPDVPIHPSGQYVNWTGVGMPRGFWEPNFNERKALTAIVSVGIDNKVKIDDSTFKADLTVKFDAAPAAGKTVHVNAFLLEDGIEADGDLRQINYSGGPKGGKSPLNYADDQYMHNNVLRDAPLGTWGKALPATIEVDKTYTQEVTFTVHTGASPEFMRLENVNIVAYVAYHGAGEEDKEILNASKLNVAKTFHPASVNNTKKAELNIMSVYPNPSKAGDVVTIEFDVATAQKVTMNVYNMMGQKVATPYTSDVVRGGHFIQWKTGFDNLAAGTYIIEVATASSSQTQQVTIQ